MIKDILAVIGLIVLYVIWLFSPIIMVVCAVFVSGAVVISYVLFKFVGLW